MPSSSQFLPSSVLASCAVSRRKTCPNRKVWNYSCYWHRHPADIRPRKLLCRLDVPPPALELLLSFGFLPHIHGKAGVLAVNSDKILTSCHESAYAKSSISILTTTRESHSSQSNTSHGRSWMNFRASALAWAIPSRFPSIRKRSTLGFSIFF